MAAGNAVIGALRVVLGADSAELETGLKSAAAKVSEFGASVAKAGAIAGAAFAAIGVGIAASLKGSLESADKLGKMSQSVGIPVEELSKLKHAADLSDVSLEALGTSVGKLSKNMVAVAGGASNDAAQAFTAMGVAVKNTDGTLRSSSLVLGDIAEKFKGYEDGAAKTALAMALFGKAGAQMIPLLNSGRDGLQEMKDEAAALGIVIDEKTAKAAENFNDNLTRLGKVKEGIITQVMARLAPALAQLSTTLFDAAKNSDLMKGTVDGLANAIKGAISIALGGIVAFQRIGAELSALWNVLMAPNWQAMKQAWAAFTVEGDKTDAAFKGLSETIQKFWTTTDQAAAATGQAVTTKMAAPIIQAAGAAKNALLTFLDSTVKKTEGLKAEAQAIGLSATEMEKEKIIAQANAIAKANNITVTAALRQKIDETAAAQARWNIAATFGKQVFEQTRTPAEQFGQTIERLNIAYQSGAINADTYARGVAQAQDKMAQASPYAQALGNSLTSAFDKAIQGGTKLSDVLKSLLQDLARALANQAFKSLLFGNSSTGGTSAGLLGSLFSGTGSPMNILPAFAQGGSFTVGGAGGIDSQIAAMRVSPGERVTVSKKGDGVGGSPISIVNHNDFRGADAGSEARIKAYVDASSQRAVSQAVGMVGKTRSDSPGYLRPR